MSKLDNIIKWAEVTLPDNDKDNFSRSQVKSIGQNPKQITNILPYGFISRAPVGTTALLFNVNGNEEKTVGIPISSNNRKKAELTEVGIENPVSKNYVLCRETGVTELNGSDYEGIIKIEDLTGKLNDLITEFDTHTHSGVQTGGGVSGVPVTPATAFNKSDYENESVKHGFTSVASTPSGSGNGILNLNGLTAQVQSFAVGIVGSDFNISSSVSTHTFNLPTASAVNRGALSSADWTTFNNKLSNISGQDHSTLINLDFASAGHTGFEKALTFSTGLTRTGDTITTDDTQIVHNNLSGKQGGVAGQYFHLTNAQHTIATQQATTSQDGYLLSSDWNIFNNKLSVETDPIFTASPAFGITSGDITNWDTAYGWGDHSTEGYLKNIVEDTTPQLGGDLDTNSNDIKFLDNDKAIFGTGLDFEIYHDGNDTIFRNLLQDKDTVFNVNLGGVDTEAVRVSGSNGYFGIGTSDPQQQLHLAKEGANGGIWFQVHSNTGTNHGIFNFNRARGTLASPTAVQSGDNLGSFRFNGHDGTAIGAGSQIIGRASENWSVGNHGSDLNFFTVANGATTTTQRMIIGNDGILNLLENPIDNVGNITHDDATASDWIFRNSNLDKFTRFFGNDGGLDTELLTLDYANRSIGINQPNPTKKLHITDAVTANSVWERTGGTIFTLTAGSLYGFIGTQTDNQCRLLVNDTPVMRLGVSTNNYNISVGNFDADEKLQVDGNISLKDDNYKAIFGTGKDGEIFVDSNDDFNIKNVTQDKDIIFNVNYSGVDTKRFQLFGDDTSQAVTIFGNGLKIQGGAFTWIDEASGANARGEVYSDSATQNAGFLFIKGRGTEASPAAIQSGDLISRHSFSGYYDGSNRFTALRTEYEATENWSSGNNGAKMSFFTTQNGTSILKNNLTIENDGGVFMHTLKSGATAAGAGASSKELWITSGHATLPDGVLNIAP